MTAVDVQALVDEPALRLVPRTSNCRTTKRGVRWVATTELPDPTPFLRGGELVMTTGLRERSDAEWRDVVSVLARLPTAPPCYSSRSAPSWTGPPPTSTDNCPQWSRRSASR